MTAGPTDPQKPSAGAAQPGGGRAGFRPGEDLAPAGFAGFFSPGDDEAAFPGEAQPGNPEPAGLGFTPAADAGGTDFDVLMGYQLFLGRDPESSFVIADAKNSPVGAFIRALMGSGEFQSAVLDKLAAGRPLPHEAASLAPLPGQLDWLFRHIRLPTPAQTALRAAPDWREWLRILVAAPGFPRPPARGDAPVQAGVPAHEADDGFVLVHLEQPKAGERLHPGALVNGSGWAIAPADVAEVAVHLDDRLLTHARYGLPRPDVARSFPHYRHVDHCGFSFSAEIPVDFTPAPSSQLVVSVRTARGETGSKSVRLSPPPDTPAQASAPAEGWPIRLAVEEAVVDADRTLRLRGWAASQVPMRTLTAVLGDRDLGEIPHGLPRPDIARAHPGYGNAGTSGFALSCPLPQDLPGGPGFVRVQAEDERGHTRQTIVPVTMPRAASGAPEDLVPEEADRVRCACDLASLSADGVLAVGGWAFAAAGGTDGAGGDAGPVLIAVELDGVRLGEAQAGQKRPDVAARYPGEPAAANSGFTFNHFMDTPPDEGEPVLVLHITGPQGTRRLARPVSVEKPERGIAPGGGGVPGVNAQDVRLEVDRPALDGDRARNPVRGALTISGWAIARRGLAGVSVFCDQRLLGHAHLGMRREDIGAAFPDYEGSLLGGYALVLPPGTLPEGEHRIRIVAQGEAARPAGMPVGGASQAATVEREFSLTVERYDALPPDGTIRTHIPPAEAAFGLRLLERQDYRPLFEIEVEVAVEAGADGAASQARLAATLNSLVAQVYAGWTATARLAGKPDAGLQALQDASSGRIRLTSAARGKAPAPRAQAARKAAVPRRSSTARDGPGPARFVMRLRAGDLLGADALLALAAASAADRDADFIYADELRNDPAQGRRQPFFKPDWSPDLLLAMNYVGRPWAASRALAVQALADRNGPAAGDYDAVLRLTEQASRILHVPRVLCERGPAGDAVESERAALAECLRRRGLAAEVEPGQAEGTWRVRRSLVTPKRGRVPVEGKRGRKAGDPVAGRVSIVIPTCGARGLVRTALKTIRATTAPARKGGRDVEIILLDNTPVREKKVKAWMRKSADIVVDMPGAFNWSAFNNAGARAATGEYPLFLNDDIEIAQPDWLDAMIEHAQRPEVGVVGARLLYPDGKVQHGGQYLADTHARHAFRFADSSTSGPFGLAQVAREMISVTGACQMVRASVFRQLGGFEEAHSVVNNDLDFCLRSWRAGLSVVFTPHATMIHHELASRAALDDSYDEARFAGAWRSRFLAGDPFRNPRLGLDADHYGADPEPAHTLHVGRRGPPAAEIRRILAVKLDHIGDFLTALPALRSLARRFPAARIDLLAPAASAELARQEQLVAETLVFDFFHARSGEGQKGVGEAEFLALQARLAPRGYDLAIDLRMQPETRMVLPYTGAALLAGYDHGNRFPFLHVALEWEGDTRLVAKRAHISERLVQLVSAVEDACSDPEREAPGRRTRGRPAAKPGAASPPALAALPAAFRERRLVCVHPGVGNVVRQWPPGHYAALIDLLAGEGLHSVLIGGPDEAVIADEVLRRVTTAGCVESLVGRVKLAQLPDVMRACALFVGNNSGPQHIAASLGLPAIGIHSGVVDASEWAPLGPQALAIRKRMICSPCYLEFASDCPRDLACLTGLRPAEVFAECRRLLA